MAGNEDLSETTQPASAVGDQGMPLVSILTPVLNATKYLDECVDSVLKQTYPNVEHVFADGGSTDGTLERLERYKAAHPGRINYVSGKDNGVGSALKRAYSISQGDILGWIDSDDKYEPAAIETAVKRFREMADAHFIYGGCNLINEDGEVIGCFVIRDFDKKEWVNVWHYIVFCATFFRREVIERAGFVNDLGNDVYFYLNVAKKFRLVRVDDTLTNWRLHSDSISLKKADREDSIRKDRAKEDFQLVLKHRGSLLSPKSLIYYGIVESRIPLWIRRCFFFTGSPLRWLDGLLKDSMYVAHRKRGSFTLALLNRMLKDVLAPILNLFSRRAYYHENLLHNSANMGFDFCRAGQRLGGVRGGAVVSQVRLYMDKIGDPTGVGSCLVRRVSDDEVVGCLGRVNVSTFPGVSAPRPKWVLFDDAVNIPEKGDYRIVFEWDAAGGDQENYPRVRFNDADTIPGVFTQGNGDGNWVDHRNADASIKIRIE